MSKVLVDRELLERLHGVGKLLKCQHWRSFQELGAILTQPAEAEGLEVVGFLYKNNGGALTTADMDADTFALMARSDFDGEVEKLVRQSDHLDALSAVTAERDKIKADRAACWEEFKRFRRTTDETERELRAEVEGLRSDASPDGFVSAPLEPSLAMQNAGWHE